MKNNGDTQSVEFETILIISIFSLAVWSVVNHALQIWSIYGVNVALLTVTTIVALGNLILLFSTKELNGSVEKMYINLLSIGIVICFYGLLILLLTMGIPLLADNIFLIVITIILIIVMSVVSLRVLLK